MMSVKSTSLLFLFGVNAVIGTNEVDPLQNAGNKINDFDSNRIAGRNLRSVHIEEKGTVLAETDELKDNYDDDEDEERRLSKSIDPSLACGEDKMVTVYKFCTNGDYDHGNYGEHRLRLDGEWLTNDYRDYKEGLCTNTGLAPRRVKGYNSLTVGTEEHDWTDTNAFTAKMISSKWYSRTCGTYTVDLAQPFEQEKQYTNCLDVSASGTYKDAISAEIGISSCVSWTAPAKTFEWMLKVEPADTHYHVGWHTFRNKDNQDLCMDLSGSRTKNRTPVVAWTCTGNDNQRWYFDWRGRLRSGVHTNKCLEWGDNDILYSGLYISGCTESEHQRWKFSDDGYLTNMKTGKYIGVGSGCGGVQKGKRLEAHSSGTCPSSNQKKWIMENS